MMVETGKSSKKYLIAAGLVIAVIAAIVALSIISGEKEKSFMVGYWGVLDDFAPGKPCSEEFFEITMDGKFFPWKYEKKWGGHGRDPDITSTSYNLNDKNEITVKKFRQGRSAGGITGVVERISASKVIIRNVKGTQLGIFALSGAPEIILIRCPKEVTDILVK